MKALVADDDVTNRILLKRLLSRWGYDVLVAEDGNTAWQVLSQADGPRLAVLDWLMPGVDGVELCRKLAQREAGPYIYTVLVTHKSATGDLATALDAGADDFVRKPVDPIELRSRLGVARRVLAYDARIEETARLLKKYGEEMESLAEERARQLVHADRMVTLGLLSAGVAHEINNPTTFISGNAQTIERFWKDVSPLLELERYDFDQESLRKLRFVLEEMPNAIASIHSGVARIAKIVRGLKDYSRQRPAERKAVRLRDCIERALELCGFQLEAKGVEVSTQLCVEDDWLLADAQQVEQVVVNLLVNASDAMDSVEKPRIVLQIAAHCEQVTLQITDCGPGIPEELAERIWNPFFTTKPAAKGTGLGLSICQRIVEEHGGELRAHNHAEGGACFTMAIPRYSQEAVS